MHSIEAGEARIPALGFGTWQLEGESCTARVADALARREGERTVDPDFAPRWER